MSARRVEVIGNYLSPYVRKVLVCLDLKGIDYRIDPIVPFFANEKFSAISPLRRIPVLIDASVTLSDSTVICEYLEELHPNPPLYPTSPPARARARWPVTAAFVARTLDHPSFAKLRPLEDLLRKIPIAQHREALAAVGAPLTPSTLGTESPRRGILSI